MIKEEQLGPPVGTDELDPMFSIWIENLADLFPRIRAYSKSLDVNNVPANSSIEQSFTVTGVSSGDMVLSVNKPTFTANFSIAGYRVSAKDTVDITFENTSGAGINLAAETYKIAVLRT